MDAANTITMVCVCDDHYFVHLAALIKSVEVNHATEEKLVFYIVEDAVSELSKRRLLDSINHEVTTLNFVKMEECTPDDFKLPVDGSSYPLNIYMRLFIPYFLPQNIERVIYLDVDMVLQEDISVLWKQDLKGLTVAAVQDPWVRIVSKWGGIENYKEFGLQEDTKYFNTGLLIMNLEQWREDNITAKVIKCINSNKEHAHFPDQYGLNVVLANKWLELNALWNCFAYHEGDEPYLIHFTGRKPIYKSYYFREDYKSTFYKYLQLTQWSDFKPIGETKRYLKKINNFLSKFNKIKKVNKMVYLFSFFS
ncbi:glycosyltransferase family 8 protein [Rufibacter tibetensis]|uniref:Glycosyl transferase n=1 Tax=Rufibacter tibetensis TaxID=512763 RepID=A0A0P0C8Q8_9BACT|nr:glycosyltransferase family 8 protein [Rufibacter tibetensis]ALI99891.1 glycosyl transferase [Rufibacter tibetensis]